MLQIPRSYGLENTTFIRTQTTQNLKVKDNLQALTQNLVAP